METFISVIKNINWYYVFYIIIALCLLNSFNNYLVILKEQNDIKQFEVKVTTPNDQEAIKILDEFISNCLSEYMLLTHDYKREDEKYINSEMETMISHEVGKMVIERISPILLDKLSFYYNIDQIGEIIGKKVYIQVTAYVAMNNLPKSQSNKK